MRLSRAVGSILALMLLAAAASTWWLTRAPAPERPWVGAVSVLAGDGRDGWRDGSADEARFSEPFGIAAAADGRLFVSDAGASHRIRQLATDGMVTTIAGSGRGFADGRGSTARFATPSGIAMAPDGDIVIADTGNHAIRRVTAVGVVTTIAGDGIAGYVDGPSAQARFNAPVGVAVDAAGRILVADTYNDRVRVIDTDGEVRTLAGGDTPGYVDGPGPESRLDTPCGIAVAPDGRVLVADTGNGLIRAIALDGHVSTVLSPIVGLDRPIALTAGAKGDVYAVDELGKVAVLPKVGDARLLAGGATGYADGVAGEARFRRPAGIAWVTRSATGGRHRPHLVIADAGNAMVRLVTPTVTADGALGVSGRPSVDTSMPHPEQAGWSLSGTWPWATPDVPVPPRTRVPPAFDAEAFARTPLLWPVAPLEGPHEVAGTFGEARGDAGHERFHAGLDVRENQGTPVRAVRDGIVASPIATVAFETLNESVRVGPLTYVHIRVGRRPRVSGARLVKHATDIDLQRFAPVYDAEGVMRRMRAKRGAFFATGDEVGTVNAFNHVHLNVGWSGEEHNPLRFRLVQFSDGIAPSIAGAGVRLFDEAWQPLNPDRLGPMRGRGRKRRATRLPPVEPVVVSGRVRIVVDAWDQADGNKAYRRLGLYAIGYAVGATSSADTTLTAERRTATPPVVERVVPATEVPRMTQVFDRMRRDTGAARQVYATGSGIPVYGASRTQFLYVATTAYLDGIATEGFWDTTLSAPGEYELRVSVADFSGNRTTRGLRVVVVP